MSAPLSLHFSTLPSDFTISRHDVGGSVDQELRNLYAVREFRAAELLDRRVSHAVLSHDFHARSGLVYLHADEFREMREEFMGANEKMVATLQKQLESCQKKDDAVQAWIKAHPEEYEARRQAAIQKKTAERDPTAPKTVLTKEDRTRALEKAREERQGENKAMPSFIVHRKKDGEPTTMTTTQKALRDKEAELDALRQAIADRDAFARVSIGESQITVDFGDSVTVTFVPKSTPEMKRFKTTYSFRGLRWVDPMSYVESVSAHTVQRTKKSENGESVIDTSVAEAALRDVIMQDWFLEMIPVLQAKALKDKVVDICKRILDTRRSDAPAPAPEGEDQDPAPRVSSAELQRQRVLGVVGEEMALQFEKLVARAKRSSERTKELRSLGLLPEPEKRKSSSKKAVAEEEVEVVAVETPTTDAAAEPDEPVVDVVEPAAAEPKKKRVVKPRVVKA